jgi:asparagine synthase (glutamine-hydrolysing)
MLLHFEDRDSMAHSIESRVPFLDYRFVELVLSLPDQLKIKNGISKYIFREAMAGILPDKIKNRTDKMGFVTPEQLWIKNNSSQFRNHLEKAAHFFKDVVREDLLLKDFDAAVKNNSFAFGSFFWRLIALHHWALTFKVNCCFNPEPEPANY